MKEKLLWFAVVLSACNNDHLSRMDEFKLRSECSIQSEKVIAESRWKQLGGGMWIKTGQNHYNREMNKCFVHVHTMEATIMMDVIVDAYEDSVLVNCSTLTPGGRSCNGINTPSLPRSTFGDAPVPPSPGALPWITNTLNPDEADKRIKYYMEH
jgi:hypothetical protein